MPTNQPQQTNNLVPTDNFDTVSIHSAHSASSHLTASSFQIPVILPTFGLQSNNNNSNNNNLNNHSLSTSKSPSEVNLPCRKKKENRARTSRKQMLKQTRYQELSNYMSDGPVGKTLRKIEEEEGPYDYHSGTRDGLFEEVLKDPELRKMWHCFVSLPGEAQEKFVRYLENSQYLVNNEQTKKCRSTYIDLKRKKARLDNENENNNKSKDLMTTEEDDSGVEIKDTSSTLNHNTQPNTRLYSHLSEFQQTQLQKLDLETLPHHLEKAQTSYNNIQKKVRIQMKKLKWDRIPIDLIKAFERELLKHFKDEKNCQMNVPLIKMGTSSYERTWCHRICDYYFLKSVTETDNESGNREKVFVATYSNKFVRPQILFSQYLALVMAE